MAKDYYPIKFCPSCGIDLQPLAEVWGAHEATWTWCKACGCHFGVSKSETFIVDELSNPEESDYCDDEQHPPCPACKEE